MNKLTADAVRKIAGRLDEGRIIEILKTGASEAELVEAFEWLYSDDALAKSRHHAPDSRIALLRDILNRHETETDEDRQ
jgi:hypothetical protein